MSILNLLKLKLDNCPNALSKTSETVRKISTQLDTFDTRQAAFIACFAYLLNRVAWVDRNISPDETRIMEHIVMKRSGLPENQAAVVVQMAQTQNLLFGGTENYLVAREFRELASHRERLALLDCLFAVAASHDSMSTLENNEISQIADELRIEHHDFIAVRSGYRDHLSVLKQNQ